MKFPVTILLFYLIFFPRNLIHTEPESLYVWPVAGHKMVTGSFGEFRMFYFHHGLDFATEGRIGVPILAMQSGRIIKLQSLRYSIGNSILIKQSDGYIARYGHLSEYSERIRQSVPSDIQSKLETRQDFDRELNQSEEIFVNAGEVIGASGNTGIGPAHLHVELIKDDYYFNPADFLPEPDTKGEISATELELVPIDEDSFINGKNNPFSVRLKKVGSIFLPIRQDIIKIKGKIGIYLSAHESSGRTNRIGFQKITTLLNERELQEINLHKIKNTQMHRSCFIFDNYKSNMSGRPFRYVLHNREKDSIDVFKYKEKDTGIIQSGDIDTDSSGKLEIRLEGLNGKLSSIKIDLQKDTNDYEKVISNLPYNVQPGKSYVVQSADYTVRALFSASSVFFKDNFTIDKLDLQISEPGMEQMSSVYKLNPDYREFNTGYELEFKTSFGNDSIPEKIGLFGITEKGKVLRFYQTAYLNPQTLTYKIHLKSTGLYAILKDNSSPGLRILHHKNGVQFENRDFKIYLRASDTGSGVGEKGIRVLLDGEEGSLDFDPEAYTWELFQPASLRQPGHHTIEARATDRLGNQSETLRFHYTVK